MLLPKSMLDQTQDQGNKTREILLHPSGTLMQAVAHHKSPTKVRNIQHPPTHLSNKPARNTFEKCTVYFDLGVEHFKNSTKRMKRGSTPEKWKETRKERPTTNTKTIDRSPIIVFKSLDEYKHKDNGRVRYRRKSKRTFSKIGTSQEPAVWTATGIERSSTTIEPKATSTKFSIRDEKAIEFET